MRRLGWTEIGPTEATAMAEIVKGNLDAILTARKGRKP